MLRALVGVFDRKHAALSPERARPSRSSCPPHSRPRAAPVSGPRPASRCSRGWPTCCSRRCGFSPPARFRLPPCRRGQRDVRAWRRPAFSIVARRRNRREPRAGPSTSRASFPAAPCDASATAGNSCEVVPRPAGVDDRLGAERRVVRVGDEHRVVLRAHAALDDVDVDRRVAARRHRPHHFLQVRRVDVVVDHHRVARHVRADAALAEDVAGLARVAGVALLDRHHVEHARAADLVRPHRLHVRHAGGDERVVQQRRAHHRLRVGVVVGRLGRRAADEDRVFSVNRLAPP